MYFSVAHPNIWDMQCAESPRLALAIFYTTFGDQSTAYVCCEVSGFLAREKRGRPDTDYTTSWCKCGLRKLTQQGDCIWSKVFLAASFRAPGGCEESRYRVVRFLVAATRLLGMTICGRSGAKCDSPNSHSCREKRLAVAYSFARKWGKRITSRIVGLSVRSIVRRSTPMPKPPFGGIPYFIALR